MANNLPFDRQVEVISALTEGVSIRATERLTDMAEPKKNATAERFDRLADQWNEFAQDGQAKKKGGMSPEQRVAQIDEAVGGLTAEQKGKITAILNKVQEAVMALPAEERGAKGAELRQAANKATNSDLTSTCPRRPKIHLEIPSRRRSER